MTNKNYIIPIKGKEIAGKVQKININIIELDEFNPRISMSRDSEIAGAGISTIEQKMIEFYLKAPRSYIELKNSIKNSGGAMMQIWVYPIEEGKYKVIEGNTRLVIHRDLEKEDYAEGVEKSKYSEINCIVLPEKIDNEMKDYIRLICHLRGHTDWDVYERAKYLNNLYNNEKYPAEELAKITKLSAKDILQDIEAYKIMDVQFRKKYGEVDVHQFSYFREFVKNKKLRYTMELLGFNEDTFCDWVAQKKLSRAMDVRKLNEVLNESSSREFFLKKDLDRAIDILKSVIPERSEKVYMLMAELNKKIDKIEFSEIEEINTKDSKKRGVILKLYFKLKKLLDIK